MSRQRAVLMAVLVVVVAAGACNRASGKGDGGATATTVAGLGQTPTTDGGSASGSSSTTAPTTKGGKTASTTAPSHSSTTATSTAPGSQSVGPPVAAAAGTYTYRQSGSSTSGGKQTPAPSSGTLAVDKAADGSQAFHRYADRSEPPEDTIYLDRSDGRFITRIVIRASVGGQQLTFTCTFTPPLPAPAWPPDPGRAFNGHGDCGAVQADVSGTVDSIRQASVDGQSRTVRVVKTTTKVSGQVQGQITETDWFDPGLGLDLHAERHTDFKYGFSSYASDLTSDLESARPA